MTTVFVAAIGANSQAPAAAQALIDFLGSADAAQVIKANGMERGLTFNACQRAVRSSMPVSTHGRSRRQQCSSA